MIRYVNKEDVPECILLVESVKDDFAGYREAGFADFDGDAKGTAARACYHSCGFVDAEELTVFDYPCQKMVCTIE